MNNQQVAFRRIRGRVVPIKLNKALTKGEKDLKQGASLIGSGVGLGLASGAVYRQINKVATAKSVKAFRTLDKIRLMPGAATLFSYARKQKAEKMAFDALKGAKRIGQFATPIRLIGQIGGAALIGAGVAKALESKFKKKHKTEIAAAVGTLAGGAFLTGAYKGAGFRSVIKPLLVKAYPKIRAFKMKFHI